MANWKRLPAVLAIETMKTGINPRRVVTRIGQGLPAATRARLGPFFDWLDRMFVDHGVLRILWKNRYKVGGRMWRSNQPLPSDIAWAARQGIGTVINLRGARECGSYLGEREACRRLGIALIDFPINSRSAPAPSHIRAAKEMFERIAYPALFHCKSGADRAGLFGVLYLHFAEGKPIEDALAQLSWRYGHLRQGRTGVLDHFFAEYIKARDASGVSLIDWVEGTDYDAAAMTKSFRATMLGTLMTDIVLRRE